MGGRMRQASRDRSRARSNALAAASADGTAATAAVLEDIEARARDLSGAWPDIGKVWAARQRKIFETESLGRWKPLAVTTILRKRREGIVADTLVETGTLRRELSREVPRSQGARFAVFGPSQGAPIDYVKHHTRGEGVPQRNPVPRLAPAEHRTIVDLIREHMGIA